MYVIILTRGLDPLNKGASSLVYFNRTNFFVAVKYPEVNL
jgi:hypothetical protein